MGYRSLKKILGEKNLERKCFVLFGIALVVLIGGGFYYVDHIAENLVMETTNNKGRDRVDTYLHDLHWEVWSKSEDPVKQKLRDAFANQFLTERFDSKVLSKEVPETDPSWQKYVWRPDGEEESAIVQRLRVAQEAHLTEQRRLEEARATSEDPLKVDDEAKAAEDVPPVFESFVSREQNRYYYYQPIYWKKDCINCHGAMYGRYAHAAADGVPAGLDPNWVPFFVVKVAMPYEKRTGTAIAWTRATLTTVAIVTVVVALVALWIIVRYVVVKPLNHLRDVSDAVARGHIEQRAEINTGDEFEELATSFNKMLRHLVDTQAEIRNINQSLDAKVDELAQLNMRLYDMNRMKSEFLAGMSHELRTPLNSIIGFSEVLQGIESLTDKQRRYVQNIQKSGRQLLDMINEILDLAKLEAGRMELRLSEFEIDRLIAAQCDMVRPLTEEKNLDLIVNVPADLPPLYQDQAKIQQILTNLLSNAIKFTPEGGRITVSARSTPQGMIELTVADTGVGIAEADREIIFEKFRQGAMVLGRDALTREFSGTGLGLSIVKELCKRMGGEVTVESELGRGSKFRVLLPWMVVQAGKQTTPLQAKLDELTRPNRAEFGEEETPSAVSVGPVE
jgi:signal transduction histidine kinase